MYDDFKLANYSRALLSPELFARHLSRLYTGDVVDGFTVTPGTGLQVVLAPGNSLIRYGSANVASARLAGLVANFSLAIGTADASNPRIDQVVLYVDNAVSLPSGTPTSANLDGKGVVKAKIVPGTPTSSPVPVNAAGVQSSVGSGNPYTILARVQVDAGVSVIAANKITDVRSMAKPTILASTQHKHLFNTTGVFTAPMSGQVTVTVNSDAHNTTGSAAIVTINCTSGTLTKVGAINYQTVDSGSTATRSNTAVAVFSGAVAGQSYTFSAQPASGTINWSTFGQWMAEFTGTDGVQA